MTVLYAFDADVLIYAAITGHPFGRRVAPLFAGAAGAAGAESAGMGSVLLLVEVLAKPMRSDRDSAETLALTELLSRLDLVPLDEATARVSLGFAVKYGLNAPDATHLATAVLAGADCFLTNNRKDFPKTIVEIEVVYPEDLPEPDDGPAE